MSEYCENCEATERKYVAAVTMIVGRLGGGCHELNYLQRVDHLRATEEAARRLLEAMGPARADTDLTLVRAQNALMLALARRPS